jgi:hypothetical protein
MATKTKKNALDWALAPAPALGSKELVHGTIFLTTLL